MSKLFSTPLPLATSKTLLAIMKTYTRPNATSVATRTSIVMARETVIGTVIAKDGIEVENIEGIGIETETMT